AVRCHCPSDNRRDRRADQAQPGYGLGPLPGLRGRGGGRRRPACALRTGMVPPGTGGPRGSGGPRGAGGDGRPPKGGRGGWGPPREGGGGGWGGDRSPQGNTVRRELRVIAVILVAVAVLMLAAGTVVTGTGPLAGDAGVPRYQLPLEGVTQLHA